jgi:hypothetical protein
MLRSFMTSAPLAAAAAALSLAALPAGAQASRSAGSCGILTAGSRTWIVVSKGVSCSSADRVVRTLAARTARVRAGATVRVASPLHGFTCVLASRGKPAGSCATAGAAKSIVWIVAA